MQKRKIHKSNQPMPMDSIQDALDDIFMGGFAPTGESVSQMVSSVISNSIELSKLVIDNRVRNSEKLQDEDIYDIYKKSIKVAMQAMEPQ